MTESKEKRAVDIYLYIFHLDELLKVDGCLNIYFFAPIIYPHFISINKNTSFLIKCLKIFEKYFSIPNKILKI